MPSFKPKTNKKIVMDEKSSITLDSKHRELQMEFKEIEDTIIPELKTKKQSLKNKLKNSNITIEQKLDTEDKIRDIIEEIKIHKIKIKNYYLNNSQYIFDYFENKKEISKGKSKTKVLDSFFKVEKKDKQSELNKNL